MKHIVFFIAIICWHQKVSAQAGVLDSTFGENGIAIHDYHVGIYACVIQDDGKVIIAKNKSSLWRFNPDGSADENFGIKGLYSYKYSGSDAYSKMGRSFGLAFQQDGKILMLCEVIISTNEKHIAIIRVNAHGSTDSSFGTNGISIIDKEFLDKPAGIAVKPNGKIIVNGDVSDSQNGQNRTFLLRLNEDGNIDKTFGDMGFIFTNNSSTTNSKALIIRSNGKIISASKSNVNADHPGFMLASFNENGSADSSFGMNGFAAYTFGVGVSGTWKTDMYAIALQPDGKIVCTGSSGPEESSSMALCRFNADGSIDKSFGKDGGIIMPGMEGSSNWSIAFQHDGKILTTGFQEFDPQTANTILSRFTPNGEPDPTFGENGTVTLIIDPLNGQGAFSVFSLPDMKILIIGISGEGNIFLARYK